MQDTIDMSKHALSVAPRYIEAAAKLAIVGGGIYGAYELGIPKLAIKEALSLVVLSVTGYIAIQFVKK